MALLLGGLIGLERQWRQNMAGTRTNALVAAGAATYVMVGFLVPDDPTGPARIAGQIVSGIGFLGAGVILKEGINVRGLNTAATVWCSSAVGTISGIGHPAFALVTALGILIINIVFRPLAYKFHPDLKHRETNYHLDMNCVPGDAAKLRMLLIQHAREAEMSLHSVNSDILKDGLVSIRARLTASTRCDERIERMISCLAQKANLASANWRVDAPQPVGRSL